MAAVSHADSSGQWAVYLRAADQNGSDYLDAQNICGCKNGARDLGDPMPDDNDAINGPGTDQLEVALGCFDMGVGEMGNGYVKDVVRPALRTLSGT